MLGILFNIIAFLMITIPPTIKGKEISVFAAIVAFLLIIVGAAISESKRQESDSGLYRLLMIANILFSGILLLVLLGAIAQRCGCA